MVRRSIDIETRKDFNHVFRGSSTLVEALQCDAERPSSSTSTAIPFFYFDFNDPAKLTFRNLIHSLIIQLLFRCPGIPLLLKDLYMRNHEGKQEPKLDDLISVLKGMAAFFDHTYIILDALDECTGPERAGILRFLAEIKSWGLHSVHLLATSQPVREIEERMESLHAGRLDLHGEISCINHDIQLYVKNILDEDYDLRKWGVAEKASITETLVKRADGM